MSKHEKNSHPARTAGRLFFSVADNCRRAMPRSARRKMPVSPGFCCRTRNLRCGSSGTPDEFPPPRDAKTAALKAAVFLISLCGASAGETTAFSECASLRHGPAAVLPRIRKSPAGRAGLFLIRQCASYTRRPGPQLRRGIFRCGSASVLQLPSSPGRGMPAESRDARYKRPPGA